MLALDSPGNSCSIFGMWKPLTALLFIAAPLAAQEQPTAYDALRVLSRELGRDSVNHVISLAGPDGAPQPERWKILIEDSSIRGELREIEVADGRILSAHAAARELTGSTEGATIDTRRLNLDSSGAFAVASHTADKSGTPFATATYRLRADERGEPVWIVTLQNEARRPVGTIYIGANRGNVTRTEGLFAGAPLQESAAAPEFEPADQNVRGIFETTKSGISHGFYVAQHEARAMFERVKRSFSDFINGD
jgi:hypothetical protein